MTAILTLNNEYNGSISLIFSGYFRGVAFEFVSA
jgi:hypothetical protein